jgi:hypothetical protein
VSTALATVRESFERDELGADAAAAAGWLLGRIVTGGIPIRNGAEAAELLRALVDVARLEAGESTSNTVVAHVGPGAVTAVLALRDQARAALAMTSADQDQDHDQVSAGT